MDNHNGGRRADDDARAIIGTVIIRIRAGVVCVEGVPVIVAVMAVVRDVVAMMVVVAVGVRRGGDRESRNGHASEEDFMDVFHFNRLAAMPVQR